QWGEILDKIAAHVREHRTTLVFVNTRRLAERVAHLLAERLGEDRVAAHHGSLSRERRQRLEARLRSGELGALVATASLELGIDIGPVELVCQIGSPRSLATFLQRVGRSGHARGATAKGRLYPTSRDELVESVALLRGRRSARSVALTSGGAIPETADYRVVADPDDTVVGTVNEDWAIESMAGDVFLLGSTSWRIRRVEAGVVRVVDAQGAPPSVPFWLGSAPARTQE